MSRLNLNDSAPVSELVRLYVDEHLTGRQIAAKVGMSNRTVLRRLHAAGVTLRNPGDETIAALTDRETVRIMYEDDGLSTTEIARSVGCGVRTVATWLSRHGIQARPTGSEKGHKRDSTEAARAKMRAGKRDKFIGPDNPNWKGGRLWKDPERGRRRNLDWVKAVKDRDGWCCTKCGAATRLHAHHIKPWRHYPELRYELSNGTTLCHECHAEAHGRGWEFRWRKVRPKPTSASVP